MNTKDENALVDLTPESMRHKTPAQLADLLEKILQAQLELMQAGQGEAALLAAQKTQPLAEYIAACKFLNQTAYSQQANRIKKLYTDISIIVNTDKTAALAQLGKLRRGKKSLNAYRSSTSGFTMPSGSNA